MRQSHLILSNTLIIWVSRVLLLVPQLVLVPYLIHTIGEAGYGVYALFWSLLMTIEQLQLSMQQGVVKYSAAFLAQGRVEGVNRVVSSSFLYSLLLAVLASVGIISAAALWQDPADELNAALWVVGVLVLFIMPLTPYVAVIQSRQRYYVGAATETLSKYLSLGIIFAWFTWRTPSVKALIIIMAGTLLLSRVAQVPFAYGLVPGLKNKPTYFDWASFRLILSFGGMVVLLCLCNAANTTGVRWLMGLVVSTSFVAHLAIILMPGGFLMQIIDAMTITVMPAASSYEAIGNDHMLRELLVRSMRYSCILVLASVLAVALLIKDVLAIWVGPSYTFLVPYSLTIFVSVAFLMTTSSAHHMLKGLGKLRLVVVSVMVGWVIVPLTLIVTCFFLSHNSYISVTLGLFLGNMVWGVMHLGFAIKVVGVRFRDMFMRVYAQPLTAAVVAGVAAFALVRYGEMDGLVGKLSVVAITMSLFFTVMFFLFATLVERRQAKEIAQLLLSRLVAMGRTG